MMLSSTTKCLRDTYRRGLISSLSVIWTETCQSQALASLLQDWPELLHLKVCNHRVLPVLVAIIGQGSCKNIKSLSIQTQGLDISVAQAFAVVLALNGLPLLESLRFSGRTGKNVMKAFLQGLAQGASPKLKDLLLPWEHMKEGDYTVMADVLEARMKRGCAGLVFDPFRKIDKPGPIEACRRIIKCSLPTISDTVFIDSSSEAEIYAYCLATTPALVLTKLEIGPGTIGSEDCLSIAKALSDGKIPALKSLGIEGQNLPAGSIQYLSTMIQKKACPFLYRLCLCDTELHAEDVDMLMKAFESSSGSSSSSIRNLDF